MITRIREVEGGFRVTLLSADGEIERRETDNLATAFAWQEHASKNGAFPSVKKGGK